ncbi:MAG: WG repeat-containing protein [Cytophagales bacterium]
MNFLFCTILFLFPFFKEGKWFLSNERGEKISEKSYDYISNPNVNGFYIAGNFKGNSILLNNEGKEVSSTSSEKILFFYDSLIAIKKQKHWSIYDADLKLISVENILSIKDIGLQNKFKDSLSNSNSQNSVYVYETTDGKKGYFSKSKFLTPNYKSQNVFDGKYFEITSGTGKNIYDKDLNIITSLNFDEINVLGPYYLFKKNNLFGILKTDFSILLKPEYKDIKFKSFEGRPFLIYSKINATNTSIYDIENKKEIFNIPFSAISELENGEYVETISGFPRYVQITNNGQVGVYDIQTKQTILTPVYKSIGYLNKNRFVVYDNYSKFKIVYNNKIISKDTILGIVHVFDSLPVTYFYKDILENTKINRYYGAFNISGEVVVPFPVSQLHIYNDKIVYLTKSGQRQAIKYDANGKIIELIKEYKIQQATDTLINENTKKMVKKCFALQNDFNNEFQFVVTDKSINLPKVNMASIPLRAIYSSSSKDCLFGGLQMIDADLNNLNQYGICPVYTKDFYYKLLDTQKHRFIETFLTEEGNKNTKKKISFISSYVDGLAAFDATVPDPKQEIRYEMNKSYFGGYFKDINRLYSDHLVPSDHKYHKGNWGYLDTLGNVVISPKYKTVQLFINGTAIVEEMGGKFLLINKKGENLTGKSFSEIERCKNDSVLIIKENFGGLGLLDSKLNIVLKADKRTLTDIPTSPFVSVFCKNKKYAIKQFNGKWLTDSTYTNVKNFNQNFAAVQTDLGWSFIDTSGIKVSTINYFDVTDFHDDRAFVKVSEKSKYILVNTKFEQIGKLNFDNVSNFEQELAIVQQDNFWGVIDHTGNWVYVNEFTSIEPFNSIGEAKAVKNGKSYIVTTDKNIQEYNPKENVYVAKKAEKLNIKEVEKYNDMLNDRTKGLVLSTNPKLYSKNTLQECTYLPFIQQFKVGLITQKGKIKLETIYQHIEKYSDDIYKIYKDNQIGYYSLSKGWIYKAW